MILSAYFLTVEYAQIGVARGKIGLGRFTCSKVLFWRQSFIDHMPDLDICLGRTEHSYLGTDHSVSSHPKLLDLPNVPKLVDP